MDWETDQGCSDSAMARHDGAVTKDGRRYCCAAVEVADRNTSESSAFDDQKVDCHTPRPERDVYEYLVADDSRGKQKCQCWLYEL
jgi:hypothetical protein